MVEKPVTMPIQKTFHSFMKAGIIHDDYAFSFKAWNERVCTSHRIYRH